MKLAIFLLPIAGLALSCEQRPLKNIREMYTMSDIQKFLDDHAPKGFILNHAIFHDDIEVFAQFFYYGKANQMDFNRALLSQVNLEEAPRIYFFPLHLAAQVGALKIVKFCLTYGANINSPTTSAAPQFDSNTPAHIAATFGKHEALKMLLGHGGFNFSSKNGEGKTIEDIAREKGDQTALSIIEEHKSKILVSPRK